MHLSGQEDNKTSKVRLQTWTTDA